MNKDQYFSIGDIYNLTKVPRSALRYYDRSGILKPAYIDEENGYRYYDSDALQMVLVLRYYQLLGFKLKEIPSLLVREDIMELQDLFEKKVETETKKIIQMTQSRDSLISWIDLIKETKRVMAEKDCPVTLREFPKTNMFFVTPQHVPKMEFKNLLINNEICVSIYPFNRTTLGALYIEYPSETVRFGQDYTGVSLFIKIHERDTHLPNIKEVGGFSAVVCYHKGSYERISETYGKMKTWAKNHNFILQGTSIERYVIDYWSTKEEENMLTEIFLPIKKNS